MLYIHCGLHKTGSTAIQNALRSDKRDRLRFNHASYQKLGMEHLDESWAGQVLKLTEKRITVLSSEAALGSMTNVYEFALERAEELQKMFGRTDYRVIIYFRPQLPWLESVYTQLIHQGESLPPPEFLDSVLNKPFIHFSQLVLELRKIFGHKRVILRDYSGVDIVSDFYSVLGLNPPEIAPPRANPSLSPARLAIMRQLNFDSTNSQSLMYRQLLQREIPPRHTNERTSPFSEEAQIFIEKHFREDRAQLTSLFQNPRQTSLQAPTRPYRQVGSVDDKEVVTEALHLIKQVALTPRTATQNPSAIRRVVRKAAMEPRDFIPSLFRHLQRRLTNKS